MSATGGESGPNLASVLAIAARPPKRPKFWLDEARFFPLLREVGPLEFRWGLEGCGVSPSLACNVTFFLCDQLAVDRHYSERACRNYRRILRDLEPGQIRRAATRYRRTLTLAAG